MYISSHNRNITSHQPLAVLIHVATLSINGNRKARKLSDIVGDVHILTLNYPNNRSAYTLPGWCVSGSSSWLVVVGNLYKINRSPFTMQHFKAPFKPFVPSILSSGAGISPWYSPILVLILRLHYYATQAVIKQQKIKLNSSMTFPSSFHRMWLCLCLSVGLSDVSVDLPQINTRQLNKIPDSCF